MKSELKHLAPYLPYALIMQSPDKRLVTLSGTQKSLNHVGIDYAVDMEYKAVLRPLSDLHKIIEHNGEKIIPFVELAKICFYTSNITAKYKNVDEHNNDMERSIWLYGADWHVGKADSVAPDERASLIIYPAHTVFTGFSHSIHFQHRQFVHGHQHTHPVRQEYFVIQKMAELNLDFMGLINIGLAIDINTIKTKK